MYSSQAYLAAMQCAMAMLMKKSGLALHGHATAVLVKYTVVCVWGSHQGSERLLAKFYRQQHGASGCTYQNRAQERLAVLQIFRQQRLCKGEDTLEFDAIYCDDLEDAH